MITFEAYHGYVTWTFHSSHICLPCRCGPFYGKNDRIMPGCEYIYCHGVEYLTCAVGRLYVITTRFEQANIKVGRENPALSTTEAYRGRCCKTPCHVFIQVRNLTPAELYPMSSTKAQAKPGTRRPVGSARVSHQTYTTHSEWAKHPESIQTIH